MEAYRFFNSTEGDERLYEADDFGQFFSNFLSTGFFRGLEVSPDGGNMQTIVSDGAAFIEGYEYTNTDDLTLTHDTADAQYDRIDRVVIRLDRRQENRDIRAVVKSGSADSSAEPPELTRDDYIWEISVAQVLIEAGKSFIESYQITDERGYPELCGRVADPQVLTDQVGSVDIKLPDTRAGDYIRGHSTFYVSGNEDADLAEQWLDSIGFDPSDVGRDLDEIRIYVETYAQRTDTGVQTVTVFDWSQQQDYKIYGKFHRTSNSAFSAGTDWGSWHEEVLVFEEGENSNGTYIRYTNGDQVCYSGTIIIDDINNSRGALYRTEGFHWEYPADFVDSDEYEVYLGISSSNNEAWVIRASAGTGGSVAFRAWSATAQTSVNMGLRVEATGRWKP